MRFAKTVLVQDGLGPVLSLTVEEDVLTVEVLNKLIGAAVVDFEDFKAVVAELDLPA